MTSADRVIVCGAGPVGLVTALRLAQDGVPTLVLEKEALPGSELRASTFHPPTLEYLDRLDLAEPLIAGGLKAPTWQIRLHETHEKAEFDLSVLARDTRYPFRLQNEQSTLRRLALDRAQADERIALKLGREVVGIEQKTNEVTLRTRDENGEESRFRGSFAIAADGGRSTLRSLLGLAFEGSTYPETTILATTTFRFEEHLPGLSPVNYVWWRGGTFSLLRLPNLWRCSLYPDEGESIDDAMTPEGIEAKLQRIVASERPYPVGEVRAYRIHQRLLADYRHGRVLFAGDAAHLNSPSGGMGMNGGLHDAFCLAEHLAPVFRRERDIAHLDRYTRRRRPIANEQILALANRNRARMREREPDRRRAELRRLQAIAADPERAREFLLGSSMIAGLRQMQTIE